MNYYRVLGAAIGSSAGIKGCEKAPDLIRYKLPYLVPLWADTVYCPAAPHGYHTSGPRDMIDNLAAFSRRLASLTEQILEQGNIFLTFGGDHSCAVGTWAGVARVRQRFGLIWIDAHMDAHTPETSPSGNLHGMPLACLLGHGDPRLTALNGAAAVLKPENLVLVGVRSYEEGEATLLRRLRVKTYMMEDVDKHGFAAIMAHVQREFVARGLSFGISLDFDGLDPRDFSGLGTPVRHGIRLTDLLSAFDQLDYAHLLGIEFAEYNPALDTKNLGGIQAIDQIMHHLRNLDTMPLALAR